MVRIRIQRVVVALLILGTGWAESARSTQADVSVTRTIVLRPSRGPELRIDFDYSFRNTLPPFENEPALTGKRTTRILIPTVPPTPLLRNITDDELYLEIDHTRDFSQGSLTTYQSRYFQSHVQATGLQVATQRGPLAIPYTIDLYTYETTCAGWFMVESGWEGELDLDGKQWTLGLVDNLDGQIDASDLLYLTDDPMTGKDTPPPVCPVPDILFFAGHTFRLDFAFKSLATEVVLEATLTELRPAMGQLDVKADGCRHLRLGDGRQTVLLNRPAGILSLPVGDYRVDNCILYDEQKGRRGPPFLSYDRKVSILAGRTTSLRLGAPLSNTVEVSHDRNLLYLTHRLAGAGGEQYNDFDRRHHASFAVYQGPLRIGAAEFPFG